MLEQESNEATLWLPSQQSAFISPPRPSEPIGSQEDALEKPTDLFWHQRQLVDESQLFTTPAVDYGHIRGHSWTKPTSLLRTTSAHPRHIVDRPTLCQKNWRKMSKALPELPNVPLFLLNPAVASLLINQSPCRGSSIGRACGSYNDDSLTGLWPSRDH